MKIRPKKVRFSCWFVCFFVKMSNTGFSTPTKVCVSNRNIGRKKYMFVKPLFSSCFWFFFAVMFSLVCCFTFVQFTFFCWSISQIRQLLLVCSRSFAAQCFHNTCCYHSWTQLRQLCINESIFQAKIFSKYKKQVFQRVTESQSPDCDSSPHS